MYAIIPFSAYQQDHNILSQTFISINETMIVFYRSINMTMLLKEAGRNIIWDPRLILALTDKPRVLMKFLMIIYQETVSGELDTGFFSE